MGTQELHEHAPAALQRWAVGKLDNHLPVLDQVGGWDAPIILSAHHFRRD
jgi:hypothetical protein